MNEEELRLELDPAEAKIIYTCEECGAEIYQDNDYYLTEDGQILCEDCFDEYLAEIKKECKKVAGDEYK